MLQSDKYLKYVRSHSCCECFQPAEHAHHHGPKGSRGTGIKAPDTYAVPLCASCHKCLHNTGTIGGQPRLELNAHLYKTQIKLLTAYLEQEGIKI